MFKVGDRVTWTSSSAGVTKTKTGVIEAVIPAGQRAPGKNRGYSRNHESYTVRVRNQSGSRLYWPLVAHLHPVTEPSDQERPPGIFFATDIKKNP